MPMFKRIAGTSAKVAAKVKGEAARLGGMIPGAGLSGMNGLGGMLLNAVQFVGVLLVKTPVGGIAALSGTTPGSGTCTLYGWDGTSFAVTTLEVLVRNPWAFAAGGNKTAVVFKFASTYWLLTWEC